jgi:hypothetical protein
MAKKIGKSKKRDDYVYGIVNVTDGFVDIRYDEQSGKIELVGAEPGSTKVERSYKREGGKGDKVVASVPHDPGAPFDPDDALKSFENVVIMDTNKRTIAGKDCAVCFSYNIPVKLTEHEGGIPYGPLAAYFIVGIKKGVNPERIGWHLTLSNSISSEYNPRVHGRLAVVTDSELGLHPDINRQRVPYYADHTLPEWAKLVYASDKETDTLGGEIIKACHKGATLVIEEMRKRANPFDNLADGDDNFEGYKQIFFSTQ